MRGRNGQNLPKLAQWSREGEMDVQSWNKSDKGGRSSYHGYHKRANKHRLFVTAERLIIKNYSKPLFEEMEEEDVSASKEENDKQW